MKNNRQICESLEDVCVSINQAWSRLVGFNAAYPEVIKERDLLDTLTQIYSIREDLRKKLTHLNRERDNEKER